MNDMSEDTIEVLLFEDLDTIHRQDWAALQQSRLYARLNDPTLTSARQASAFRPGKDSADGAINILRAGHARLACEVSEAVMPPAAGTHRSDSGAAQCRA